MTRTKQPNPQSRTGQDDLRRRLARLRSRVARESRPHALLLIDEAIEEADARDRTAE